MADIIITITISNVFREVARRSSLATATEPFYAEKTTEQKQYSQLQGEGDRITSDFTKEAAKEVLKTYISRQGDVSGVAFSYGQTEIVYRFAENEDPLLTNQTSAITTRLTNNTEDSIIYYVLALLYKTDGNIDKEKDMLAKALELIDLITGDLHRLHD